MRYLTSIFLAINYRLSPQYPFPCAIQDALAAYLYLIRPPPEAKHKPVKPRHIVIMGDSAGGGLSLATLQVIRDSGLPPCAGGVLISPWCDLSHSFPSIYTNTATVSPCLNIFSPAAHGVSFKGCYTLSRSGAAQTQYSLATSYECGIRYSPSDHPISSPASYRRPRPAEILLRLKGPRTISQG